MRAEPGRLAAERTPDTQPESLPRPHSTEPTDEDNTMNLDALASKRDIHLMDAMSLIMKAIHIDTQIANMSPENETLLTDDECDKLRETVHLIVNMMEE